MPAEIISELNVNSMLFVDSSIFTSSSVLNIPNKTIIINAFPIT